VVTGKEVPAFLAGLLGVLLGIPLQGPGANGAISFAGLFGYATRRRTKAIGQTQP
jgi:hypothetical protein